MVVTPAVESYSHHTKDDTMTDYLMVMCRSILYRRSDRGASLVEYALLVGLIALVCIVGVAALGGKTSKPLNSIAGAL